MKIFNDFCFQAKQRTQMLEQSVSEAQTSESRVSNLQNWISHVDEVLSEHLENDITLEDLPHDFQVHLSACFIYYFNFE